MIDFAQPPVSSLPTNNPPRRIFRRRRFTTMLHLLPPKFDPPPPSATPSSSSPPPPPTPPMINACAMDQTTLLPPPPKIKRMSLLTHLRRFNLDPSTTTSPLVTPRKSLTTWRRKRAGPTTRRNSTVESMSSQEKLPDQAVFSARKERKKSLRGFRTNEVSPILLTLITTLISKLECDLLTIGWCKWYPAPPPPPHFLCLVAMSSFNHSS